MRFMRAACIVVLLASVASGESDGCAAGSEGSPTCHAHVSPGDATSLLQLNNLKLETGAAALTTRCSTDPRTPPSCEVGDWTDWGACSKTSGWGVRTRSRNVISAQSSEDCCLEEGETCKIGEDCVPEDCKFDEWGPWGACELPDSVTCGQGHKSRDREVKEEAKCGGTCAPSLGHEVGDCEKMCPQEILGKLCVNVREAANFNNKIEKAMVTLGEKEQKQSDSNGDVCWDDVATGDYKLKAKHEDYVDWTKTVSFDVGTSDGAPPKFVDMVKKTTGDWVIVLKWGEEGMVDLDSYTYFKNTAPFTSADIYNHCKLAYDTAQKKLNCEGINSKLDQDHCFEVEGKYTCESHSKSAKPETTTLKGVDGVDGEVIFQVVNHWGSKMCWIAPGEPLPSPNFPPKDTGIFKQSKAEVTVYHGDQLVATYNAPDDGHWQWSGPCAKNPDASAEEWWLFSIDRKTGTVTPCDCATQGPGYCGGCGR